MSFSHTFAVTLAVTCAFFGALQASAKDLWKLELTARQAGNLEELLSKPALLWDYEKAVSDYTDTQRYACDEFATVIDEIRKLSRKVPGFSRRLWEKTGTMPTLTFKERPAPEIVPTKWAKKTIVHPIKASFQFVPIARRIHGIWLQESFERCETNMCTERDRAKPSRWALTIEGSQLFVLEQKHKYQHAAVLVVPVQKEGKTVALIQAIGSPELLKQRSFYLGATKSYQSGTLVDMFVSELWKRKPKAWSELIVLKNSEEKTPGFLKKFARFMSPVELAHLQDGKEIKPTDELAAKVADQVARKCYQAEIKSGTDLLYTTAGIPALPTIFAPGQKAEGSNLSPAGVAKNSSPGLSSKTIGAKSSAVYSGSNPQGSAGADADPDSSSKSPSVAPKETQPIVSVDNSGLIKTLLSDGQKTSPVDSGFSKPELPSFRQFSGNSPLSPPTDKAADQAALNPNGIPNHKTPEPADSKTGEKKKSPGLPMPNSGGDVGDSAKEPSPSREPDPIALGPKDPREPAADRDPKTGDRPGDRDPLPESPPDPGTLPRDPQSIGTLLEELRSIPAKDWPQRVAPRNKINELLPRATPEEVEAVADYAFEGSPYRSDAFAGIGSRVTGDQAQKIQEAAFRSASRKCNLEENEDQIRNKILSSGAKK